MEEKKLWMGESEFGEKKSISEIPSTGTTLVL